MYTGISFLPLYLYCKNTYLSMFCFISRKWRHIYTRQRTDSLLWCKIFTISPAKVWWRTVNCRDNCAIYAYIIEMGTLNHLRCWNITSCTIMWMFYARLLNKQPQCRNYVIKLLNSWVIWDFCQFCYLK